MDVRCEAFHTKGVGLVTTSEGRWGVVAGAEREGFPLSGGKSPRLTKGLLSLQRSRLHPVGFC